MAAATKQRPVKNDKTQTDWEGVQPPVLGTTHYDKVASSMIAIVLALILGVVILCTIWLTNRLSSVPQTSPAELELVPLEGGDDGKPDDTWKLDSPEEVVNDPSLVEEESPVPDMDPILEGDSKPLLEQKVTSDASGSEPGGGDGGEGPLIGPPGGKSGREQRWIVRYADKSNLDQYAAQLDFFNIELAVRKKARNEVIYIKNLKAARPTKRVARGGSRNSEKRMYMSWRGGNRRQADVALFQKAGVQVNSSDMIVHFYPKATEKMLARLEYIYKKRLPDKIRRTYFEARGSNGKYEFVVTKQLLQVGN